MLTEERHGLILSLVNQRNAVTVLELSKELDISESTIRRDLTSLDKIGKLNKVRGGATSIMGEFSSIERDMGTKEYLNIEEKHAIGEYAASLIYSDDVVYIDAGTSTLQLVAHLSNPRTIFITNGLQHAGVLSQNGCRVYVTGGMVRQTTGAMVGVEAVHAIRKYNFTKAFMGVNGITAAQGLTTPDPEEAQVKIAAVQQAYLSYALADHTKFRKVYSTSFAELEKVCIITDYLSDPALAKKTVIKEVAKE